MGDEMRYCVFVPVVMATYDNPVVAFFCLLLMYSLIKPFFFNVDDD